MDTGYPYYPDTPYPTHENRAMTQLHIDKTRTQPIGSTQPRSLASPRDYQRLSLIAGGVLFAIGNLLHPLQHNDAAYESATWEAAHLTIFFSIPLLVLTHGGKG